ncbi:MAG: hypothetical protein A2W91_08330 [Bacteroidetes bacterium GWF2_38_335]|nr:MAG: hypothetical protein A2W91_08330 [Bacteroidetes bacterium GWF2_38_335]OFY78950.1 MAG: hypothetical protein A2281_02390 [Bacteroidetes bacterium RIFOXYA12_FULL_38_20]HBS86017.1 hypothetical protein [Bacteroidales bacterium]
MKKTKNLGIWMDHSTAFLMELSNDVVSKYTIDCEFTIEDKTVGLKKSENHMHIKEQHLQSAYYKKIEEAIKKYECVVLFGPTDAKNELFNNMKDDHLFENIKIEVKNSDKMTDHQMVDFVRDYFTGSEKK